METRTIRKRKNGIRSTKNKEFIIRFKDTKQKKFTVQTKEIKLKPNIADGDLQIKVDKIKAILEEGHRVKISMSFRGRENAHKDLGLAKVNSMVASLKDITNINSPLKAKDNNVSIILAPKK